MIEATPHALARLLVLSTTLLGAAALAQPAGLPKAELERLTLNPSGQGSLLLGTGELLPEGGYRASLTGHFQNEPLVLFQQGARVGAVVSHRVTAHLAAAYGLTEQFEVAAQVPIILLQGGEDLTARGVGRPAEGLALGTPYVALRLKLLSEQARAPVDLAVGVQTGLALGSAAALARDASSRATPSVMVGRRFGLLRAGLDAGLMLRPRVTFSDDANVRDELGDEVLLGGVVATTGERLRGELSLRASLPLLRAGSSAEALAGARLALNKSLEAYALAGVGFGEAPGTPAFRGLLGVAFTSLEPRCVAGGKHTPEQCPDLDDDNDGVKNRADACPLEGGKVDARGCPVKDADGDGVLDEEDRCPAEPGEPALQGCPDTDKDGIEDAADKCPREPGVAQFEGCPDTDGDGLRDSQDKCPAEAGPVERQGCPEKDSDGDGILDENDNCPTEPGLSELKGCPPKDTDGDLVADHLDNCPNEAGPVDNQGCPASQKQLVVLKQDRIEIKERIYFTTGKASIRSRSFPLLDQVAKVLNEHPELEKVWIEGHTDNVGAPEFNLKLSQWRAEAVRDYLMSKGVAPERLEAKGYGEERPIAPNTNERGRAANRRVEFLTTPRDGNRK